MEKAELEQKIKELELCLSSAAKEACGELIIDDDNDYLFEDIRDRFS